MFGRENEPVWRGSTLQFITGGVWQVIGVIFFSWPPLAIGGFAVSQGGFMALFTLSPPMIFVTVWWTIFLYFWLRVRRFSLDCEQMVVEEGIRHFFYWSVTRTPISDGVRICCDNSYGPLHPNSMAESVWATTLHLRLRLVGEGKTWSILEKAVTPPSGSFLKVSQRIKALAAKMSAELGSVMIEDRLDNETHRVVIQPPAGEPTGGYEKKDKNSLIGCLGLGSVGAFLTLFGVLVASDDSLIAALLVTLFGLAIVWWALYAGFFRRRVRVDAEKRVLTMATGWFRASKTEQFSLDTSAHLCLVAGQRGRSNQTPFHLYLITGDNCMPLPGPTSTKFNDVFAHASQVSEQYQVPLELSGGIPVHAYRTSTKD
jgi:uncharacterized membrane protein YciS (DUF1049 family)